jgi:hypothetical protein
MAKSKFGVKWEIFLDVSNYDMWGVRPVGDKDFNSPRLFDFVDKEDAEKFKKLVEKSYHAVPQK